MVIHATQVEEHEVALRSNVGYLPQCWRPVTQLVAYCSCLRGGVFLFNPCSHLRRVGDNWRNACSLTPQKRQRQYRSKIMKQNKDYRWSDGLESKKKNARRRRRRIAALHKRQVAAENDTGLQENQDC